MATLESLQATLAKYEAERDRILASGSSYGVDGTTRSSAALETINVTAQSPPSSMVANDLR